MAAIKAIVLIALERYRVGTDVKMATRSEGNAP